MIYQKPYLSIPDQVARLEQRGMIITDRQKAGEYLTRIGYYRLSAYWYPFRVSRKVTAPDGSITTVVEDHFRADTHFHTIVDFYVFDKKLRMLMLDALERIEIALRTQVALQIGQYGAFSYRDPQYVDGKFVQNPHPKYSHAGWLQQLDTKAQSSKEQFAEHFRQKYSPGPFPIWIAVELLDFGPMSFLLGGMKFRDRRAIAQQYGIPRPDLLVSWVRTLCNVRNTCAHHARLWNKPIIDQPRLPRRGEMPEFDHLLPPSSAHTLLETRLYIAAAICCYMLRTINPSSSWKERLKVLLATFPQDAHVTLERAGFPASWQNEALWR